MSNSINIVRFIDVLYNTSYVGDDGKFTSTVENAKIYSSCKKAVLESKSKRFCGMEYYEVLKKMPDQSFKVIHYGY